MKQKGFQPYYFLLSIFFLLYESSFVYAQCGTDPISGTVTVSTTNQIINSYYPGLGNPLVGNTSLTVGTLDARGSSNILATGDLVLIIQMQGVDLNTTNTSNYGSGTATGSGYLGTNRFAGNYEYNTVASVAGSTINFSYSLAKNYYTQSGTRTYQVIRIPRYYNLTITGSGSVICPAWNGNTGGVVVLDAANVMTLNGTVSSTALGFRGGGAKNFTGATAGNTNGTGILTNTDYRFNSAVTTAANLTGGSKGEGIAGVPMYVLPNGATTTITTNIEVVNGSMGRGAPGNAGGGGTDGSPIGAGSENQYNTGGGGGANAGNGGKGGSGWHGGSGNSTTYPNGGFGGTAFSQRSVAIFIMGGGGGAGTANNSTGTNEYQSSGGAGGGIILLRAASYAGTGILSANGGDAPGVVGVGGTTNTDAAGGGGGGGSIIAITRTNVTVGLTGVTANANGGKGGDMTNYYDHGPGGGGGGGFIVTNGSFASANVNGGTNGLTRSTSAAGPVNNLFGSSSGSVGQVLTLASAPFMRNSNNGSSPCGTLPVTLLSFTGVLAQQDIQLKWTVASAINFSEFEIEHSLDGISFSKIGVVPYVQTISEYAFTHTGWNSSLNFYRLKMIDNNSSFRYSPILAIRVPLSSTAILPMVYPQPVTSRATLRVYAKQNQSLNIRIFNAEGSLVKNIGGKASKGINFISLNELNNLSPGIYFLRSLLDDQPFTLKMVIGNE